jgi:Zn-dependent metalloprotease
MNEGFSDIWGACIEFSAAPTKSTWLIGEDIERRTGHVSLRSMSNQTPRDQTLIKEPTGMQELQIQVELHQ